MPDVDGGSLWEMVERRAAATPDDLVEGRLGLGRREHHVELHVFVGSNRLLERFFHALLVVPPAAAHDADVHPCSRESLRAAFVTACFHGAEQHTFGLVEISREVVRIDRFVDFLVGGLVSRELRKRWKGAEQDERHSEDFVKHSAVHLMILLRTLSAKNSCLCGMPAR